MTKKKKIVIAVLTTVLILAALLAAFWDTAVMYLAPQIPVQAAMEQAFTALEARYRASPAEILMRSYDPCGEFTFHIELTDPNDSAAKRNMVILADLKNNRIQFQGVLPDAAALGDVSLYLGREFAALTSSILNDGYYGITYETFSEDIRSFPLVSLLMPERLLAQMEECVNSLREKMCWSVYLPDIPQITVEDVSSLSKGLWLLRPHVSRQARMVNGQSQTCWKVAYTLQGEAAQLVWEKAMKSSPPDGSQIRMIFYLYNKSLVDLELEATDGSAGLSCALTLGEDPREDDLSLAVIQSKTQHRFSLTNRQGRQTLKADQATYDFEWNPQTGNLLLLPKEKETIILKLEAAEGGFRVDDGRCVITVTKGAGIRTPEYKNLDQWSLEDLGTLLRNFWTAIQSK